MVTLWWKSLFDFERDLRSASDETVEMLPPRAQKRGWTRAVPPVTRRCPC